MSPLQNITIAQLEQVAKDYAEKYEPRFRKAVQYAFVEAVVFAQKVERWEVKI